MFEQLAKLIYEAKEASQNVSTNAALQVSSALDAVDISVPEQAVYVT